MTCSLGRREYLVVEQASLVIATRYYLVFGMTQATDQYHNPERVNWERLRREGDRGVEYPEYGVSLRRWRVLLDADERRLQRPMDGHVTRVAGAAKPARESWCCSSDKSLSTEEMGMWNFDCCDAFIIKSIVHRQKHWHKGFPLAQETCPLIETAVSDWQDNKSSPPALGQRKENVIVTIDL